MVNSTNSSHLKIVFRQIKDLTNQGPPSFLHSSQLSRFQRSFEIQTRMGWLLKPAPLPLSLTKLSSSWATNRGLTLTREKGNIEGRVQRKPLKLFCQFKWNAFIHKQVIRWQHLSRIQKEYFCLIVFFKLLKMQQVIMWGQGEVVVAQVVERWHFVWAGRVWILGWTWVFTAQNCS